MKSNDRNWCMCDVRKLKGVARDCFSTCSICGGMDAYGESKLRPPEFEKQLSRTESKEQDVCPECGGSCEKIATDPSIESDMIRTAVMCHTCKGTGKAPVDKIREAFEHMCSDFCLRYDFSVIGVAQYKDANTHQAFCIFAGQQAEIERLKRENEDLRCCGNCGNEENDFAFHFECRFKDKCKLYLENQKESYWVRGE